MTVYNIQYYVFSENMFKAEMKLHATDEKHATHIFYESVRKNNKGDISVHKISDISKI